MSKELLQELDSKEKEIEQLNKDIIGIYQKINKTLLDLSNGLSESLMEILERTKNKRIDSDLYNIHILADEGLETYRKVYARKGE